MTAVHTDIDMLEEALWYAAAEARVFPLHWPENGGCSCRKPDCEPIGKHPLTGNGFKNATTDPDTIRRWWTKWPHANIGLVTGEHFDVIDIDGTPEAWDQLVAHHGRPANIGIAVSGRQGGFHIYTRGGGRKTIPTGRRGLPPGIEIKAVGGYVVAPPSLHHSGRRYRWAQELGEIGDSDLDYNTWYDNVTNTPTTPAPTPAPVPARRATPTAGNSAYGQAILDHACQRLANARSPKDQPGAEGRHNTLINDTIPTILRAHAGGEITDLAAATIRIQDAARSCGLSAPEIANIPDTVAEFNTVPRLKPLVSTPQPGDDLTWIPAPAAGQPSIEDQVFDTTDTLNTIRQSARAQLVSPWALLGTTLARIVAETDHRVVLPAIIGAEASLNLYVGLVGPSGAAKTSCLGVVEKALNIHYPKATIQGTGSGEGLIQSLLKPETDPDTNQKQWIVKDQPNLCTHIDEIGTIGSIQNRQGSTLGPILRSAWSGSNLDTINADPTRIRRVPAGSYRLCIIAGIQPAAAGILFDDAGTGTPQRWLWLPALDPDIPDHTPQPPSPLNWTQPKLGRTDNNGRIVMNVPGHITDQIRHVHRQRMRGQDLGTLDGHLMLARLKTAAALALLHQRLHITDQDWQLAAHLTDLSTHTRDNCQHAIAQEATAKAEARGKAQARTDIARRSEENKEVARAATAMWKEVGRHADGHFAAGSSNHSNTPGCTAHCLKRGARRYQGRIDTQHAIDHALDEGWLTQRDGRYHQGEEIPPQ